MQRALQARSQPQPLDLQIREQLDRQRHKIKAWKDGFFDGALVGFMLTFLIVFLVGPVASFMLAFLLVFLAALWVKFLQPRSPDVSRSPANDGKPRGIPGISTGPRSGKNFNRSSSNTKTNWKLRRVDGFIPARRPTALFERQLCEAAALLQPTLKQSLSAVQSSRRGPSK